MLVEKLEGEFEWNQKNALCWFLGQIRNVCFQINPHPNLSIEKILHPYGNNFYFLARDYAGKDLFSIFQKVDENDQKIEKEFKKEYSIQKGWHDPREFPGKLIFEDFSFGDRRSYFGANIVCLMKATHPDQQLWEISGRVITPYAKLDENRIGTALFELEKPNGEKVELNSNYLHMMRAEENGEITYHNLVSSLKPEFSEYDGYSHITTDSKLAIISANRKNHSFRLEKYAMVSGRRFGCGTMANFEVMAEDGEKFRLNINDLNGLIYTKAQ